jgi:Flp pilus assembly protein TadD
VCLFLCHLSFAPDESPAPDMAERQLLEELRGSARDRGSEQQAPDVTGEIPPPGAVSTARLAHRVPKLAAKAFDQASKLVKKHRYADAAVLLENAITIDPEFADAHNDLGAQYMALGRIADAEQEFRKAVALDAAFAVARANLAVSKYALGDFAEAEKEAQRALSFAPSNRASRHLLDLIRARRERGF